MKPAHFLFRSTNKRTSAHILFSIIMTGLLVTGTLSPLTHVSGTSAATTDSLIVGMSADITTLDPALATENYSLLLTRQIFDTLTVQPASGAFPEPGLAINWTVTPDGQTWVFTIRSGVTFHDGTPVDAQAIRFNIERWWDAQNAFHIGAFDYFFAMFGGFKGEEGCILEEIVLVDDDKVQLVLSEPYYALPTILSIAPFAIASPAAIQAGTLAEHPVGSGPFKFISHVDETSISLEPNLSYWGTPPSLSSLQFNIIPDANERLQSLLNGSIDSVGDLSSDQALIAVDQATLQVQWRNSAILGYLGINSSKPGLDDPLVRQAIAHAINLPELIAANYPFGDKAADQFLAPAIWGRDPTLAGYSYDPDLSISLLNQAGYSGGFSTTLAIRDVVRPYLPDPWAIAEDIQAYLAQVDIQVTLVGYENADFLDRYRTGEFELFMLGWGADYLHPDNFFSPILCDPTNLAFGLLDDTLCTIVQTARAEPDTLDQLALYQAASRRVYDNVPLLPLVNPRSALVMRYDLEGVEADPMWLESYKDASYPGVQQVILDPEEDTSLVFTNEDMLTTIDIPAGAVEESILLRFAVTDPDTEPLDYRNAGITFELEALQDGDILVDFTFLEPVTFTINYTDADVFFMKEETLLLFYWDGNEWLDAASTCDPVSTYVRDLEANLISLAVCHLTPFGLFAEANKLQLLPMIQK